MWRYRDFLITVFLVFVMVMWLMFYNKYYDYVNTVKMQKSFTYKDWQVLYEICNKKSWSKTSFILKSYWSEDTDFKNFLLGIE